VQADYSQAELRTIAVVSGDKHLRDIYLSAKDLHTEVATDLFGADFSKEQRVIAKNYNFGIAYGQEAFSFSQMYHISKEQARRHIDTWWSRFPGVWEWTREVHKKTRQNGELVSAFGRKRRFPLITDQNLDHTLKEAVNFLIQSVASDFTLWSLIRIMNDRELDLARCFPIILVHDSIVLECESSYADTASSIVKQTMEDAPKTSLEWNDLPFDVDVQVGDTWGEVG
jgi:DNA polymerase-1